MENFNVLVLHMIMWRRRWCRKRQNMWVHPIKLKRPEFGMFCTYTRICSRMKRNLMAFLEWILSNSTVCHNWWERKYENKTLNIGGWFHLKNDLQFFKIRATKICRRQERDSRYYRSYPFFLISVLDSNIVSSYFPFISSIL